MQTLKGHTSPVKSIAFSHDGKLHYRPTASIATARWYTGTYRILVGLSLDYDKQHMSGRITKCDGERVTAPSRLQ
jgi:hypothetical protein